jgi:hypothetical protein
LKLALTKVGLGCLSGSYIIYCFNSVLVWAMLMAASHLTHSIVSLAGKTRHQRFPYSANAAILLRRAAKLLACANTIWIVFVCTLQFAGVYTTCWCNSAAISQGARAYVVMQSTEGEIQNWWKPLVGFTAFARSRFTLHQRYLKTKLTYSASVIGFVWFNIALNPSASR